MPARSLLSLPFRLPYFLIVLVSLLLASACTYAPDEPTSNAEVTTGEGTGGGAPGGDPDPDEESADYYTRPYDYPGMATLPVSFIARDNGKRIAAWVTLPANEKGDPLPGPFPVILVQTAYNAGVLSMLKGGGGALLAAGDPFMVRRGYAMVAVDVVGSGISQGGWEMLGVEEQAGYAEAVDWIQRQPWCNGTIGVSGASYMAITALYTAAAKPEAIKAVFAVTPLGDAMRGTVGIGGMINGVFMSYWLKLTQMLTVRNELTELSNPAHAQKIRAATQEHVDQIDNYYLPVIDKALNGDPELAYDGEFWRVRSPLETAGNIKAPTFLFGTLHDLFQRDAPLLYEKIKNNAEARLVIYDGDHVSNYLQAFPGSAEVDPMMNLMLQWFDRYLMGMDTGVENIPPVTQFVKNYKNANGSGFASTTTWPHPQAVPERWYLRGAGGLSKQSAPTPEHSQSMTASPFAEIVRGKSESGKLLVFDVEPKDGTRCSISYRQWTLGIAGITDIDRCYYENTELEADALNYESEAMAEDYYINGPIQADIWIESSVTDAVLSVRIDEVVSRTGKVTPLSNGQLLASARAVDVERSRFLNGEMIQPYHWLTEAAVLSVVPGEVFKMQVEIFPTSAIIRKGNKLRVSISPSNQAQGVLNVQQQARVIGGVTTIHTSPDYPSSVVVPVVPISTLQ